MASMMLVEALLPEWDREMGLTRQFLARVPDGQFDWRPHVRSWTLGRLAAHLAAIPQWAVTTIDQPSCDHAADGTTAGPATQAGVLALFDANAAAGRAILSGRTDAELLAPWTLLSGGREVVTMPKATVLRNFVLNHLTHHRGQLTVYLRLLDVPIPSMYGPSGDAA